MGRGSRGSCGKQKERQMRPAVDGVSRSVVQRVAEVAGAVVGARGFSDLEEFLAKFAEGDVDGFFFFVAADAQVQDFAWFLLRGPTVEPSRDIRVIPTEQFVADL